MTTGERHEITQVAHQAREEALVGEYLCTSDRPTLASTLLHALRQHSYLGELALVLRALGKHVDPPLCHRRVSSLVLPRNEDTGERIGTTERQQLVVVLELQAEVRGEEVAWLGYLISALDMEVLLRNPQLLLPLPLGSDLLEHLSKLEYSGKGREGEGAGKELRQGSNGG
eukprot:135563-Hanusia_phi.AAC.3